MTETVLPIASMKTNENLFHLFQQQAHITPEATAIVDESSSWTYAQLAAAAEQVCQFLRARNLAPEQPVAVQMQRRAELLAVLLGIIKAGGAYVPFDPSDPPERVKRLLSNCNCTLLLGDHEEISALNSQLDPDQPSTTPGLQCHEVKQVMDSVFHEKETYTEPGGCRLAYILFTSGSTAEPKAVEVEHRNVISLLGSAQEMLRLGPKDCYLATSTIAFDASITELFLPLVTGASLLLRDRSLLLQPKRLAEDIRDHQVSVFQTGPSVWNIILSEVQNFPHVRVAITHGEAADWSLAQRLCKHANECWNLYGPTEATVWATGYPFSRSTVSGEPGTWVPIGRPLPHVLSQVMDERGKPVNQDVAGELWIGGPAVARAYCDNKKLTMERFVEWQGNRYYRTGDLVKMDGAGDLQFLGRNDDQMKIRGVRIEPAEVEAALLRDPRISQAAVTWYPTVAGSRAIVAALVTQGVDTIHPGELADDLKNRLPGPMIPSHYLFVPWLPLTSGGKVDRKVLREAAVNLHEKEGRTDEVTDRELVGSEQVLSRIWKQILKLKSVQANDHFFSIGGDSLSAVQVMLEAESEFDLHLPVHLVFEVPTLSALARKIDQARERADLDLGKNFVFHLAGEGQSAPLFFSSVNLILARHGLWKMPLPLYAIANWAKGSGFVEAESLEVLAADHLVQVKKIQGKGPYRLAGYSLGGLIALEMAHQLNASGENVELLFLLDPMSPKNVLTNGSQVSSVRVPSPHAKVSWAQSFRQRVQRILQGPGHSGWLQWFGLWLPVRLPLSRYRFFHWMEYTLVNQHLRRPNAASRFLFPRERWHAFLYAGNRMIKYYVARPYAGTSMVVFSNNNGRDDIWKSTLVPTADFFHLDFKHSELFSKQAMNDWMEPLARALKVKVKATVNEKSNP